MRYTLWSRGRLVGHTDLDIHTFSTSMRQGFIEPTAEGYQLLSDATGVARALAEARRGTRARGERLPSDDAVVEKALQRRHDLAFELRDEHGVAFDFDFVRVYDNFDERVVDEMCPTAEEEEAEFEARLSALSSAAREEALASRERLEAEIEEMVEEMLGDREESEKFASRWPPPPPEDPRWDTMQYMIQVYLKAPDGEFEL